jgi:glycosyltransferase involved in cell wall biosynthesis
MLKPLIVIPHYNHNATLRAVAEKCASQGIATAVFDDGSTVSPEKEIADLPIAFIRFEENKGKGRILQSAAKWAKEKGFTHIITIDADGQHNPSEISLFLAAAESNPAVIIIGVRQFDNTVPLSSRFGRKFGGFWVHFQTGKPVADIQSGFRCYPVKVLNVIPVWCKRYAFEVEIVVRALWAGFEVREVPVSVLYAKERISHFHKLKDNLRLTLLNTHLTMRSMLPIPHRKYNEDKEGNLSKKGYWQALKENLAQPDNITKNAVSGAWGIFCGSIALPGIRQVMLFGGAGWWNLNRILSVSFEKFCIGPFIPALCIEVGYFLRYGHFLTEFNLTTLGRQFVQRVWEWVIGSLVVAPALAMTTFCVLWLIGFWINRSFYER